MTRGDPNDPDALALANDPASWTPAAQCPQGHHTLAARTSCYLNVTHAAHGEAYVCCVVCNTPVFAGEPHRIMPLEYFYAAA